MLRKLLKIGGAIAGGMMAYRLYQFLGSPRWSWMPPGDARLEPALFAAAGALAAMASVAALSDYGYKGFKRLEESLVRLPVPQAASGIAGLIVGLLVSVLLYPSVSGLSGVLGLIPLTLSFLLGAVGFRVGIGKWDEIGSWFAALKADKASRSGAAAAQEHKILDTSVIIDGRIADICKTGFIQGTLVIPEFVLEELQHIADSSDLLKRNRGRRGLDILNKMQKELDVDVLIYEGDFEDVSEVDSKLVRLAKLLGGKVITNDFNLNKVCELQGVSVLNINDLANAVKPVVLPGEEIAVQVIKDGKEYGQGIAYLDDGTMIVVEGGREFIGSTVEVMVTSVLQTSAGRMIFAKPKLLEKAL